MSLFPTKGIHKENTLTNEAVTHTHTCSVKSRPLSRVLFDSVGCLMFQQHFHTQGKSPLRCQVEGSSALDVPHVQTYQCLRQQSQSFTVAVICLERWLNRVNIYSCAARLIDSFKQKVYLQLNAKD